MLTAGAIGAAALKLPEVTTLAINASMLLLVAIVQLAMGMLFLGIYLFIIHITRNKKYIKCLEALINNGKKKELNCLVYKPCLNICTMYMLYCLKIDLMMNRVLLWIYSFEGQLVVVFFSRAFVTSYTTAVAVHVFSSQVPAILGYKVTNYYGPLKLYYVRYY